MFLGFSAASLYMFFNLQHDTYPVTQETSVVQPFLFFNWTSTDIFAFKALA